MANINKYFWLVVRFVVLWCVCALFFSWLVQKYSFQHIDKFRAPLIVEKLTANSTRLFAYSESPSFSSSSAFESSLGTFGWWLGSTSLTLLLGTVWSIFVTDPIRKFVNKRKRKKKHTKR